MLTIRSGGIGLTGLLGALALVGCGGDGPADTRGGVTTPGREVPAVDPGPAPPAAGEPGAAAEPGAAPDPDGGAPSDGGAGGGNGGQACGPTLCGADCAVLRDETLPLPSGQYSSDYEIGLAVDRHGQPALLAQAGNVVASFGARQPGGDWAFEKVVPPGAYGGDAVCLEPCVLRGQLAFADDGETPLLLPYSLQDAATRFPLLRRDPSGWQPATRATERYPTYNGDLFNAGGRLHALVYEGTYPAPVHASLPSSLGTEATWSYAPMRPAQVEPGPGGLLSRFRLAVSPEGHPFVAFWASSEESVDWTLFAGPPDQPAEEVLHFNVSDGTGGGFSSEVGKLAMGVTDGPAARPHLLVPHRPNGGPRELTYLTREPGGPWSTTRIAADAVLEDCPETPPSRDATCRHQAIVNVPLGVATSACGEVQLVYASSRLTRELTVQCPYPSHPEECQWFGPADRTAELHLVTVAAGTLTDRVVSTEQPFDLQTGTLRTGADGTLHMVGPTLTASVLRYLAIGRR